LQPKVARICLALDSARAVPVKVFLYPCIKLDVYVHRGSISPHELLYVHNGLAVQSIHVHVKLVTLKVFLVPEQRVHMDAVKTMA
jgi:hypothetical protein